MSVRARAASLIVLTLASIVVFLPGVAQAAGIGLGLVYKSETIHYDESDAENDINITGLKFVLDTAVARKAVFNYRLGLGYEKQTFDAGNREVDRVALSNTFGFAVLRTKPVRLWLGPQLSLGYGFDSNGKNRYGDDDGYSNLDVGVALMFGANFNMGPVITVGVELGYGVAYYNWDSDLSSGQSGYKNGVQLSVILLFRMHDSYSADKH